MPCSPARSEGIHSPLQRGGVGGGAVYLAAGGRGTETTVLLGLHPRASHFVPSLVEQGLRALFSSKQNMDLNNIVVHLIIYLRASRVLF